MVFDSSLSVISKLSKKSKNSGVFTNSWKKISNFSPKLTLSRKWKERTTFSRPTRVWERAFSPLSSIDSLCVCAFLLARIRPKKPKSTFFPKKKLQKSVWPTLEKRAMTQREMNLRLLAVKDKAGFAEPFIVYWCLFLSRPEIERIYKFRVEKSLKHHYSYKSHYA